MGSYTVQFGTEAARDTVSVDVSSDLAQPEGSSFITASRGYDRATVGARPRAGSARMVLNNTGLKFGLLDPRPGLGVALDKTESAATSGLWYGNIDRFVQRPTMARPIVELEALGVFARLAGRKVSSPLYENITTGAAIAIVCDLVGIPASLQDLDTGLISLRWWWCDEADALEMLIKLRMTEGVTADLFEGISGAVTFRDRDSRFTRAAATASQGTFTSEGAEPQLSDPFEWIPEWREIVNEASHPREVYLEGASGVVWTDDTGLYLIPPGTTLIVDARPDDGFLFKDAITPLENTDFTVGYGSIASVTLSRTSGAWTRITFTPGALGASILVTQLRATTVDLLRTVTEKNSVDASTSIAAYDLRPWAGTMWPAIGWAEMRDNLDAIVIWKQAPAASVKFGVLATRGAAADAATRVRDIGERITIVETDLDINFEAYIERIDHQISAPNRHFVTYECSVNFVRVIPEPTTHGIPTLLEPIEQNDIYEQISTGRRQVWVDDSITYIFGRDDDQAFGILSFWKSVDAGANWSASTQIGTEPGTSVQYDIYYERWTDPTFANRVHIVGFNDANVRGLYYTTFNLDNDSEAHHQLLDEHETSGSPTSNQVAVTVVASGRIYTHARSVFNRVQWLGYSDDGGATWTDWGADDMFGEGFTGDRLELWPLLGSGDLNDARGIFYDHALPGVITAKTLDASASPTARISESATILTVELFAGSTIPHRQWSTAWDPDTGMIYLAAWDDWDPLTAHTLLTATIAADGTITAGANLETTVSHGYEISLAFIDGSVYAFYGIDPDGVSETDLDGVYKVSADDMASWSARVSYPTNDGNGIEQIIGDPNPRSVIMPGYHRQATDKVYFGNTIPVGASEGTWVDHDTNPYEDLTAQDQEQDGADLTEQGLMLRGVEG